MSITIVGLTIGLVASLMKQPPNYTVESIDVMANDDNLVDISDGEDKTFVVNLNNVNEFSLKYVASPINLDQYYIVVTTSDSAITAKAEDNVNGEQTGVVRFSVNSMPSGNTPVTITFAAVSDKSGGDTIVSSSVKVVVTQPSTLNKVTNVKYNGSEISWLPVTSNTENVAIDASKIKYAVQLQYTINGKSESINYTTMAGVSSFKLEDVAGGFYTGTINEITIQALGDNTLTTSGEKSDKYKFYILDTPTYSFKDREIKLKGIDSNAKAVVAFKAIDDNTDYLYRQTSAIDSWSLASLGSDDKIYDISFRATIVDKGANYTNILNSVVEDDIEFFDSPVTNVTKVAILDPVSVTYTNETTANVVIGSNSVTTYGPTRISWSHAIDDASVRRKISYLVNIVSGSLSKNYVVDYNDFGGLDNTPIFDLTSSVLSDLRSNGDFNQYVVTVSAFMPMNSSDLGADSNAAIDNVLVIDSGVAASSKVDLSEYTPSVDAFGITINGSILSYTIPTKATSEKYIEEIELVFVSDKNIITKTATTSSQVDLQSIITESGTYDLYIFSKGHNNTINHETTTIKKSGVYQTIGAPTRVSLSKDGILSFDAVAGATSYNVTYQIGASTYSDVVTTNDNINVIDKLDNFVGYHKIASNVGGDAYVITIESVSSVGGVFGAATTIGFYKFAETDNIKLNDAGDKIVWDSVDSAISYKVSVGGASVIVNNGENYLSYIGTEIEEALVSGDNTITLSVMGLVSGSTILQSNFNSGTIVKLSAISDITITDDTMYFADSIIGNYVVEISSASTKKEFNVSNISGSVNKLDLLDLADYNILDGIEYSARVKVRKVGAFDSEYSAAIKFKKLAKTILSVIDLNDAQYIVWEKSKIEDVDNIRYVVNAINSVGNSAILNTNINNLYYGYNIADIAIGESGLGITGVGEYLFEMSSYTNATYTQSSDMAYLSSTASQITIVRLAQPSVEVVDYQIRLNNVTSSDMSKITLGIDMPAGSSDILAQFTNPLNAIYDTKNVIVSAGEYNASVMASGNISSDFNELTTRFVLDSQTKVFVLTKLAPVELSITSIEGVNRPTFAKVNTEISGIQYDVYRKLTTSAIYSKQDIDLGESEGRVVIADNITSGNYSYYVVCSAASSRDNYYLSSGASNIVEIRNTAFTAGLTFVSEDELTFYNHKMDGVNVTSIYVLTITNKSNNNTLIYNIDGVSSTITSVLYNDAVKNDVAEYALAASNGVYTLDIAKLKEIGFVTAGQTCELNIHAVGIIDDANDVAYNSTGGMTATFTYHNAFDTSKIAINDTMQLDLGALPSGYTLVILDINNEEFVVDTNNIQSAITGTNNSVLGVSKTSGKLILDFAAFDAGTYSYTIKLNKTGRLGVVSAATTDMTITKNAVFGTDIAEKIVLSDGLAEIVGREGYTYTAYNKGGKKLANINNITGEQQFAIRVSKVGALISDESDVYTLQKLASSTISASIVYDTNDKYQISQYVITWDAKNKYDTDTDLASKYIIRLTSDNVTKEYVVVANSALSAEGYSITYSAGTYTLIIDHSGLGITGDDATITMASVVGSTIEELSTDQIGYITNNTTSTVTINFLAQPNAMSIVGGKIQLPKDKIDTKATAELIIYDAEGKVVESKIITPTDLKNGYSYAPTALEEVKIYTATLRYIGGDLLVTNQSVSELTDIRLSTAPTASVSDGALSISVADGVEYTYTIDSGSAIKYNGEGGVIDTTSLSAGQHTMILTAVESGKLNSKATEYIFHKLSDVADLSATIDIITGANATENLKLSFTANNMVGGVDKVSQYIVTLTDASNSNNSKELIKDSSDLILEGGKYVITIEAIGTLMATWQTNNIVATIQVVGDDYISNMAIIEGRNKDTLSKLANDQYGVSYYNGNLKLTLDPTKADNNTQAIELHFVQGENTYIYTHDFQSGTVSDNIIIDFASVMVMNELGEEVLLPSGDFKFNIYYMANSSAILDSVSGVNNISKATAISSIQIINNATTIWCGNDNAGYVYNYIINNEPSDEHSGAINFAGKESGIYTISIQSQPNSGALKSNYSENFTFMKLSAVLFDAEIVRGESDYYIQISMAVPEPNRDTTTGKDLAQSYSMTIGLHSYTILANQSGAISPSGNNTGGNINVIYDNYTYIIRLDIDVVDVVDDGDALVSGGGKVYIHDQDISSITITLNNALGYNNTNYTSDKTNGVLSVSTRDITEYSIELNKLDNSNVEFSIDDGKVNVTGLDDVAGLKEANIYFYQDNGDNTYTHQYTWQINANADLLFDADYIKDLTVDVANIPAGDYLVVVNLVGDNGSGYIDADAIVENASIVETPILFVENGVIKWNDVSATRYNLSYVDPSGKNINANSTLISREGQSSQYYFDMSSLDFDAGTYIFSIRAKKDNAITSSVSQTLSATKLDSPTINNVINGKGELTFDRVAYLEWKEIRNASKYYVYDYSANVSYTTDTILVSGEAVYRYAVDLNVMLGQHKYYVMAGGTLDSRNLAEGESYYLNSSNGSNNPDTTKVAVAQILTNTVENIRLEGGILTWDTVANIDYYKLIFTPYTFDSDAEEYEAGIQYITSTTGNTFDIKTIDNGSIQTAEYIKVEIENKTVSNKFLVKATTETHPLNNFVAINTLQDKIFSGLKIENGMIVYNIWADNVAAMVSVANYALGVNLDYTIRDVLNSESFLYSFITPNVTINNVKYQLGDSMFANYSIILKTTDGGSKSFDITQIGNIAEEDWTDCNRIKVEFVLSESFPSGKYTISLSVNGNTFNDTIGDIPQLASLQSQSVTDAFKLTRPGVPRVESSDILIHDDKLVFAPSVDSNSNNVTSYMLTFSPSISSVAIQNAVISTLTTSGVSLDTINNLVVVDIYDLFVAEGGFEDFIPLTAGVNYKISVKALGGSTFLNSDYSNSSTSFKVISAPILQIGNEAITWQIEANVEEYIIYFYNEAGEEIVDARQTLTDVDGKELYTFSDIRDNSNLGAGIYNIKVRAIGNGKNMLSSRLSDSSDFFAEKLAKIQVSVENGLYTWDNATYILRSNAYHTGDALYYGNYIVDVYHNGNFNEAQDRYWITSNSNATKTIFELPEKYLSRSAETGAQNEYTIKVYSNTSGINYLLPNDIHTDIDRYRSDKISGTISIGEDGNISWTDSYNNDYIVFIYSSGNLVYTSGVLKSKSLNIYSLYPQYDSDGVGIGDKFVPNAGSYTIKIKSIDKTNFSDTSPEVKDAILRSVYTADFYIRTIHYPEVRVTDGDISWNTTTSVMGSELAATRITIKGKVYVGDVETEVDTTLKLEFGYDISSFQFQKILAEKISIEIDGTSSADHYKAKFTNDNPNGHGSSTIQFIEGQNYEVSIRFFANENRYNIAFGENTEYVISSEAVMTNFVMLNNPDTAVNPRQYEASTDAKEQSIFSGIPSEYKYSNYIYWEKPNDNVVSYNIEIYTSHSDVLEGAVLRYIYKIRGSIVTLYQIDNNGDLVAMEGDYNTCLSISDDNIYFAMDRTLNTLDSSSIYIYLQSIGDTIESSIAKDSINDTYYLTYHLATETKLAQAMEISLPSTPESLSYDNNGTLSWEYVRNVNYEIVVAYQREDATEATSHYNNITRLIINYDNFSIHSGNYFGDKRAEIDKLRLQVINLLGLNANDYNNRDVFDFQNTENVYYVDIITINSKDVITYSVIDESNDETIYAYYKLRYLSNNITNVTIRAIGNMSVGSGNTSSGDNTSSFISKPTMLEKLSFTLFAGGDGSKDTPFVIKSLNSIEYYIDESCHFVVNTDITETVSATLGLNNQKAFNGVLDGGNYSFNVLISSSSIDEAGSAYYAGLFYNIASTAAVINMNIVLTNNDDNVIDRTVPTYVGVVAIYNYGLIANVNVSGDLVARITSNANAYIGGVVYSNMGTIAYANVSANITETTGAANARLAGIAVYNGYDNINYANAGIYVSSYSGIMTGRNMGVIAAFVYAGTVDRCYNTGTMSGSGTSDYYIGGLVCYIKPQMSVTISNSYVELAGLKITSNAKFGAVYAKYENGSSSCELSNIYTTIDLDSQNSSIDDSATIGGVYANNAGGVTFDRVYYNSNVFKQYTTTPSGIGTYTGDMPDSAYSYDSANPYDIFDNVLGNATNPSIWDLDPLSSNIKVVYRTMNGMGTQE